MSLGRQKARQESFWVARQEMPKSPGNPFYERLNALLCKAGFDAFVEELCAPFYAKKLGRPSIPPGRYFRMLLLGYSKRQKKSYIWSHVDGSFGSA